MAESWIENKIFSEIMPGDMAETRRLLTRRDVELFAVVSGDVNPTHLDEVYAGDQTALVAHSLLGGALISGLLGTRLPGPGTAYREQDLQFLKPLKAGDTLTIRVTVAEKQAATGTVLFDCLCRNQDGDDVITGQARVTAPTEKIRCRTVDLPDITLHRYDRMAELVEHAKKFPPLPTAIVHPCDAVALQGMESAAKAGLIIPILVGPEAKVQAVAASIGLDISRYEIVDSPHSHASAVQAVTLVRTGRAGALMKGSLHTDELMGAVVSKDGGLRTDRRMSHVFVMDAPTYKWPLLITDAALNIAPSLPDKKDICQNAIDLAHALGLALPKVAILAATESVDPSMQATLDAAALCKMADRGQITGALLDGPLALDNAINVEAARIKHITSPVAGDADILVVPNIESGNMMAKQLHYLGAAESAGLVIGAKVPIILTSRADSVTARLASAALAVLHVNHR
jgi:phosphate acetyltransferase